MNNIEQIGRFFGEQVAKYGLEYARKKVEQFDVSFAGIDNLLKLQERPYLLAANHIKPVGKLSEQSGLAPDALIFERLIEEQTNRQLRIIAKCDDGWWSDNLYRYFQKYIGQSFGKGMIESLGFIPIKKNPGSFNKDFMKAVDAVVLSGEPILVFPEGVWKDQYMPEDKLETGAATIALRHNLPIVPAFIDGGRNWQEGETASVLFGQHFDVGEMDKEEITNQIRNKITSLQDLFYEQHQE